MNIDQQLLALQYISRKINKEIILLGIPQKDVPNLLTSLRDLTRFNKINNNIKRITRIYRSY